jgi:hypothetical protein
MKRAYVILAGLAVVAAVAFFMVRQNGGLNKMKRRAEESVVETYVDAKINRAVNAAENYAAEPAPGPVSERSTKQRLTDVGVGLVEKHQDDIAKTGVNAFKKIGSWLERKFESHNKKDNPSKVSGQGPYTPRPPSYAQPPIARPAP